MTPYYYKYSFAEIDAFYAKLADASGLPVVLYNISAYSGVSFEVSQLENLLSRDYIAALKFTSKDVHMIERLKFKCPDKPIFNGSDEVLLQGLYSGADGAIGATYNTMSDKAARLFREFGEGNYEKGLAIQHEISEIIERLIPYGGLKCHKALLTLLGFETGGMREPFAQLADEVVDTLRSEILPKLTLNYKEE